MPGLAPDVAELRVDVTKGSGPSWKDEPCFVSARGDLHQNGSNNDRGGPVYATKGAPVFLVVQCEAAEGTITRILTVPSTSSRTFKVDMRPSIIVGTIERDGKKTSGTIVVYDDHDIELARGPDQTVLYVMPGKVRVVGIDKDGIHGETNTTVRANARSDVRVDAANGMLLVNVTNNDVAEPASVSLEHTAVISRNDPYAEVFSPPRQFRSGALTAVPSGTWDIITRLDSSFDFHEVRTRVVIPPRQQVTKTIPHVTGELTVTTSPSTGVAVTITGKERLFRPEVGVTGSVLPGRYRAEAVGEAKLDWGHPNTTAEHVVVAGKATKLKLATEAVIIEVETRVGGLQPAVVEVKLTEGERHYPT
jgi:hypothetical protein